MQKIIRLPLIFITLILLGLKPLVAEEQQGRITLSAPPASLAKWYKPANKRQVWLHTMFRLRRSMQAVAEYSALEDRERLVKWAEQLVKDYRSIAEMVPEWRDELELEWATKLLQAAKTMDSRTLASAQRRLGTSCNSCHNEYRPISAVLFRGPDFSSIKVEDEETLEEKSYGDVMAGLSTAMNRVKIGLEDGRYSAAQQANVLLTERLATLAGSCQACHREETQKDYLLGERNMAELRRLGKLIETRNVKQASRKLGHIAVAICATCHGVHRTLSDMRGVLVKETEGLDPHAGHEH